MTESTAEKSGNGKQTPYPMHGGRLIGRILKDHGIKHVFGVQGGHVWPYETGLYEFGVERLHMRHEQAAVYAAEAYSRCTRMPGVCYGTAGPGFANMVSGIAQAYYNSAPVVALTGKHPVDQSFRRAFQELEPDEITKSITRWSATIEDWALIPLYLRKALHDCMIPPLSPIVLATGLRALMGSISSEDRLVGDMPCAVVSPPAPPAGDPLAVKKVVQMLLEAERPAVVAGEGVYWADAAGELLEFAELLNIPVQTRRIARGAVPEDHPLAFTSHYRQGFWNDADVVLILGLRLGSLEMMGLPPAWPAKAKRIVINDSLDDAWDRLPVSAKIIANSKTVLRQMIDCAKELMLERPKRTDWLSALERSRRMHEEWERDAIAEYADSKPIHAVVLAKQILEFLDDSATVVYDAYTGTAYLNQCLEAKFAGQVLDCGCWGGVGHGIGMGIGAQVARPGKQVLVLMGDGGMGVGGMDVETAVRYKLPVCFVVTNNGDWMSGAYESAFKGQAYPWCITPDVRYDKMFEACGAYGEHVTEPGEIKPALERAFNSGRPSVINVTVDPRVMHPNISSWSMVSMSRLCLDFSKVSGDWVEFFSKGPTPATWEGLRRKGYPFLKKSSTKEKASASSIDPSKL